MSEPAGPLHKDLLHKVEPDLQKAATDFSLLATIEEWEEEGYDEATKLRVRRGDVFETRLKASHHLREIGNGYFRSGDHERALVVYERSWWHADFDRGFIKLEMTDHHQEELFKVTIPLRFNLATCLMTKRKTLLADRAAATAAALAALAALPPPDAAEAEDGASTYSPIAAPKEEEVVEVVPPPAAEEEEEEEEEEGPREYLAEARAHVDAAFESLVDGDGFDFEDLTEKWKAKGLFLRAKCKIEVGCYDAAAKDLAEAIRLSPNDRALRAALEGVKADKRETGDATRAMMGGKLGPPKPPPRACAIS